MKNITRLKKYVALSDYTQGQLAARMGISKQSLNYKLNDKRDITFSELDTLVHLLGIPPSEAGELLFD